MAEQSSWFFVWIPRKDHEKQLVKKEREDRELAKKKEQEQLKLEENQQKLEKELAEKQEEIEKKQEVIENGAVNKAFEEEESECEQITGLVPIVEEHFDPLKQPNASFDDDVNIIEVKEASVESKPKDFLKDPPGSLELEESTPVESFQCGIPNELLDMDDETIKSDTKPSPRVDSEDVVVGTVAFS